MITQENLKNTLKFLDFNEYKPNIFKKVFNKVEAEIIVNFNSNEILYPENKGMKINVRTTTNFSQDENFVVLECVNRLLEKGYRPEHIELEKQWPLGHTKKSGRSDILVKDNTNKTLFIIECKTYGSEYDNELKSLLKDGGQLFSYWQQDKNCRWLILYSSNFENGIIEYITESINCSDDEQFKKIAEKDEDIKLFLNAGNAEELFAVWDETYEKRLSGDVVFRDDSVAYKIGVKPLRKKDLIDIPKNNKIINKFEEILRHNNISDKENAFNKLIALFICKLVDEITKDDNSEVEFQYKIGTDTFETLQDRLQRLHKEGMSQFMDEEIFYVSDDYADNLIRGFTGQSREKMILDLKDNLRKLKFYTNNDFAFKDVHNEELFYQNGKILVEIIQLFEKFKIINSNDLQMLGDLFEQLLNKGFKQNEGQFFTPMPVTMFIWYSLPLGKIIKKNDKINYPRIIDFSCGAGHFITEGFNQVNKYFEKHNLLIKPNWESECIYGVEKDYRLARVSKISLFMNGAGKGNIKFGDGLENYNEQGIKNNSFDILVANPPYSVASFKPHLKLKNNNFNIIEVISDKGKEIETLFVERMNQLIKKEGIAAIILPSTILHKTDECYVKAREIILENFKIKAIVNMGKNTFGATQTETVILFLEKHDYPPKKIDFAFDTSAAIFNNSNLDLWNDKDIFNEYLKLIDVNENIYRMFINKELSFKELRQNYYFNVYVSQFDKLKEKQDIDNFYKKCHDLEKEKIRYFALLFDQQTLIVNAPKDSKEEKIFLGYDWSSRKGQEGIKISKLGGYLFDLDDDKKKNTISHVIVNTFYDKFLYNDKQQYYYFQKLREMIDIKDLKFEKKIKPIKVRDRVLKEGYSKYRLNSESFKLYVGKCVKDGDSLLNEKGIYPVISANVFGEFGRTNEKFDDIDFSTPSVIWGIDGNWMVNYVDEDKPFYPTHHCGVLKVVNTKISPKFVKYAVLNEGNIEKIDRVYRASKERIENFEIYVPDDINKQMEIVNALEKIENQILSKKNEIRKIKNEINNKYNELFSNKNFEIFKITSLCKEIFAGGDKPSDYSWKQIEEYPYPVYSNGSQNDGLICYSKSFKVDEEALTISARGTIGYTSIRKAKFTPIVRLITVIPNEKITIQYLKSFIDRWDFTRTGSGAGQLTVPEFNKVEVPLPPMNIQLEFSSFLDKQNNIEKKLTSEIECLEHEFNEKLDLMFNK
ncbi:N-6 DNA methylase [Mycoplasmopsis cynos]|uniref:N-6 DNA methylase n=1 Tax=Mycoplasmopsis cynos TaxID=171284 RepID=UPI002AFE3C4C|nr:N-6 DNA methylase [Mycoplasmopsis cynos]WQQ16595.1 N-6 DNA methylase [Mycoplasmopsis cynos]